MDEPEFHLAWRLNAPVLVQRLRGFWSVDDITAYRAALHAAIEGRRRECGSKLATSPRFQGSPATTEADRLENGRFEFASGLGTMIVLHSGAVAQMQRRRIQDASTEAKLFQHVSTEAEAETALAAIGLAHGGMR